MAFGQASGPPAGARQVDGAKIGMTHVLGFGTGSAAGVHIFEKA